MIFYQTLYVDDGDLQHQSTRAFSPNEQYAFLKRKLFCSGSAMTMRWALAILLCTLDFYQLGPVDKYMGYQRRSNNKKAIQRDYGIMSAHIDLLLFRFRAGRNSCKQLADVTLRHHQPSVVGASSHISQFMT